MEKGTCDEKHWDLVIVAATTPSLTRLTHTISFHPHFTVGLCSWKPAICVCQMCYFPVQTYKHLDPPQTRAAVQKALKSFHTFLASSRTDSTAEWNPCRLLWALFNCPHFPARSGSQSPSCKKFHFLKSCTAFFLLQSSNAFPAHKLCWCRQSYLSIGGNF